MNRFLVALLAILSSTLFAGLFVASSANAASPWDSTVLPVEKLELYDAMNDDRLDISTSYVGVFQEACGDTFPDWQASFMDAVENDKGYSISSYRTVYGSDLARINWSIDGDYDVNFQVSGDWHFVSVSNTRSIGIELYNEVIHCWYYDQAPTTHFIASEINGAGQKDLPYLSTFDITYPEGYEGIIIPDSATPQTPFKPDFNWTIDTTGLLRVVYQDNAEVKLNGYGNYRTFEKEDNWTDPSTLIDQKVERPFWQYTYEYKSLPGAGYFSVYVSYEEGDWQVAPPGFTYVETVVFHIYWDGKSFIQGNNVNCETDGVLNMTVCNNLDEDNPILKSFKALSIDNHGLQSLLMAPINFIASLPSYVDNCSPITLPLMGTNQQLPCPRDLYQQGWMSSIWVIWQTVVTAAVTYYVGMRIFKTIKDVNTPHNDGIEVAKL